MSGDATLTVALQQPHWPDDAQLREVCHRLTAEQAPVDVASCRTLCDELARVGSGDGFVVTGGDCAELFDDATPERVVEKADHLHSVADRIERAVGVPTTRIGRFGGQFAKPRSQAFETLRDGRQVPSYRGDAVNGLAIDDRGHDPSRLLVACGRTRAAAQTLRSWDRLRRETAMHRPRELPPRTYLSHEALLLDYERALVRNRGQHASSSHYLWIGDRTRHPDHAHTSTPKADDQDPAPDPNSTRIAFASDGNIAILDTDAPGDVNRVTRGSQGETDPSFSSRDEIAFASPSGRTRGRTRDIVVADAAGQGRPTKRLTQLGPDDIEPAWTADGTEIFFAREQRPRSSRFRIFRMDANGRGQKAVTKGGAYADTEPAPQPVSGVRLLGRALRLTVEHALRQRHLRASRVGADGPQLLDRLTVQAAACHPIPGTNRRDRLHGTGSRDCVSAKAGNDTIYVTHGGQDHVNGGKGADHAYIDDGFDTCTSATKH